MHETDDTYIPPSRIRIRWLGHASVELDAAGTRLLFDPVVRWRIAHLRRRGRIPDALVTGIDAVLLSHAHHDHLDLPSLRRVRRHSPATQWHAPRGAARVLERAGIAPVVRRGIDDEVAIGELVVRSVPAAHRGGRSLWLPDEAGAEAIGFVVELPDGRRVWFAGDTAYDEELLGGIGPVDVALVPVGGWWRTLGPGHMDAVEAARAVELVGARTAIPIHWGTYHPIGLFRAMRPVWHLPAEEFTRSVGSDVDVRVLQVGEAVDLD